MLIGRLFNRVAAAFLKHLLPYLRLCVCGMVSSTVLVQDWPLWGWYAQTSEFKTGVLCCALWIQVPSEAIEFCTLSRCPICVLRDHWTLLMREQLYVSLNILCSAGSLWFFYVIRFTGLASFADNSACWKLWSSQIFHCLQLRNKYLYPVVWQFCTYQQTTSHLFCF